MFGLLLIFRDAKCEKREIDVRLKHAFKVSGANRCSVLLINCKRRERKRKGIIKKSGLKIKAALFYRSTVISLISISSEWAD